MPDFLFFIYPHNTEPDGYDAADKRAPKAPKPHKPKTPSRKKKVAAPVVETEEGESDTEKKELAGGTGGGEKRPPRVRQRRRRAPAPGAAKESSESLDEENAAELVNDERTRRAIARAARAAALRLPANTDEVLGSGAISNQFTSITLTFIWPDHANLDRGDFPGLGIICPCCGVSIHANGIHFFFCF